MAKLIERHDINDELYIFKQDNSERWYARFILTNHKKWLCKSTKKKDKDEAIAMAHRIFLDHQIRHENNSLIQSKRFKDVAERVIEKLEHQLEHGGGKRTYKDYIRALENYHIPYFARTFVTSIDQEAIMKFDEWRKMKMSKLPASSTLQTHNSALQLVFKEAIEQKWMIAAQVPVLSSKGEAGTRRAAFSEEEYEAVLEEIYEGERNAHSEKTRQIRELLYDYCEIAVNTGIRPGTEMENLTWKDIEIKTQGSKAQFFIHVTKGKTTKYTGTRKVVCKRDVIGALIRLRERFPMRTPNQKLLLLANGESTPQLGKAFEKALQSSGLKDSPRGPRTLYSLRHTYITWQLLAGTSMDVIARQCGTSAAMIEQHYSHVKPEMFADALSGVTFDEEKPKPKSKKTLARQERSKERDEKRFKEWAAEYKSRGCIQISYHIDSFIQLRKTDTLMLQFIKLEGRNLSRNPVIKKGMRIGELDAEADASLLEKCFVDNGQLEQLLDINSNASIIVGRTGSGKSALLLKTANSVEYSVLLDPNNISIRYLESSNIIQFFSALGIKLDLFYRMLWRHILTVELLKLRYDLQSESQNRSLLSRFNELFDRDEGKKKAFDYFTNWGDKFWLKTDERLRELTTQFTDEVKNKVGLKHAGIDISAEGATKLAEGVRQEIVSIAQSVVNGLQIQRLDEVLEILQGTAFNDRQKRFYILIDQLDEDWAETDTRYRFVRALIEETKALRRKLPQIKIVSALRRDLLDIVFDKTRGGGFQEEKYEAYMLPLQWSEADLLRLVNTRVSEVYRRSYTKGAVTFNDIFPKAQSGKTAIQYILDRTLMRPRDVIQYVNECFRIAADRENVSWTTIRSAESGYSSKRLNALQDEWYEIYPALSTTIEILRGIRTPFTRQTLSSERLQSIAMELTNGNMNDICARTAVALIDPDASISESELLVQIIICLYHVGIIGLKISTTEPFIWSFREQAKITRSEVKRTNKIEAHPMLYSALEIDITSILTISSEKDKPPGKNKQQFRNKKRRKGKQFFIKVRYFRMLLMLIGGCHTIASVMVYFREEPI